MNPRYKPSWMRSGYNQEAFLQHVGVLDVYYEYHSEDDEHWIVVVGPNERRPEEGLGHNFDVYYIKDGNRLVPYMEDVPDVHIELAEMCAIYELVIRRGYIKEE